MRRSSSGSLFTVLQRDPVRGEQVCLFTDLANPTSNKIYAAIG